MNELPKDLAGYQCLDDSARAKPGDVEVKHGDILGVVPPDDDGILAGDYKKWFGVSLYRKLAVAKQGDLDHKNFAQKEPMPTLPTNPAERKKIPLYSGLMSYFPDALVAVAQCSQVGNDQHSPGQPLMWDRSKSGDEADALMRHLLEHGKIDSDGVRHSAKCAWRAMALLQKEIEKDRLNQ